MAACIIPALKEEGKRKFMAAKEERAQGSFLQFVYRGRMNYEPYELHIIVRKVQVMS